MTKQNRYSVFGKIHESKDRPVSVRTVSRCLAYTDTPLFYTSRLSVVYLEQNIIRNKMMLVRFTHVNLIATVIYSLLLALNDVVANTDDFFLNTHQHFQNNKPLSEKVLRVLVLHVIF